MGDVATMTGFIIGTVLGSVLGWDAHKALFRHVRDAIVGKK
jgi:hypothetical protein